MAHEDYSQLSKILLFFLQLQQHLGIERTDLSTNHVLVYLEKVSVHLGLGWVRETQAWGHLATHGKRHGPKTTMGLTKVGPNFILTFAELSRFTGTFLPALTRFSLCACTQISPHLPTSHRLPQCGERPQGFPLPISQATHTPRAQGGGAHHQGPLVAGRALVE